MIKAYGHMPPNGKPFLLIGLDGVNWEMLHTGGDEGLGRPILFDMGELGLKPLPIVIVGSETATGLTEITARFFGQHIDVMRS